MTTINISIPENLKAQAQALVDGGYYSSFSDIVRDALRSIVGYNRYNAMTDNTKKDIREGNAIHIQSKKDLKKYFNSL